MRFRGEKDEIAAVQAGDAPCNRKAKPRAARLRGPRRIDPVKPLEDPLRMLRRNADAVILDLEDAVSPVVNQTAQTVQQAASVTGWDCACGQKNIMSKFCPECGTKRPE